MIDTKRIGYVVETYGVPHRMEPFNITWYNPIPGMSWDERLKDTLDKVFSEDYVDRWEYRSDYVGEIKVICFLYNTKDPFEEEGELLDYTCFHSDQIDNKETKERVYKTLFNTISKCIPQG